MVGQRQQAGVNVWSRRLSSHPEQAQARRGNGEQQESLNSLSLPMVTDFLQQGWVNLQLPLAHSPTVPPVRDKVVNHRSILIDSFTLIQIHEHTRSNDLMIIQLFKIQVYTFTHFPKLWSLIYKNNIIRKMIKFPFIFFDEFLSACVGTLCLSPAMEIRKECRIPRNMSYRECELLHTY